MFQIMVVDDDKNTRRLLRAVLEQNGYTVIKVRVKNHPDLVTVVGSMADVHVGSVLSCTGSWRIDAKYGQQFSMKSYQRLLKSVTSARQNYSLMMGGVINSSMIAYYISLRIYMKDRHG